MLSSQRFGRSRRDSEAVADWKRAADKPIWKEYVYDEARAKFRALQAANNDAELGFLSREAMLANISLPHYGAIRVGARVAIGVAVNAERRGDTEDGFALRVATRRIGALMEQESDQTLIGGLVGRAVVSLSWRRPGGILPHTNVSKRPKHNVDAYVEANIAADRARYVAYLRAIGHPEEATAFHAAVAQGEALRENAKKGIPASYFSFDKKTYPLIAWWCADAVLLSGASCALFFAAVFKLVYRFSPRLQNGEPLQASARWGIACGLVIPSISVAVMAGVLSHHLPRDYSLVGGLVVGAFAMIVPPVVLRFTRWQVGHGLIVLLSTFGVMSALIGTDSAYWFSSASIPQMLNSMMVIDSHARQGAAQLSLLWLTGGAMLSVPLLLLGAFAVFSRMFKVPVAAGVTRGMRAVAVPLACLFVLAWAGCLIPTLRHENAALKELRRIVEVGETQTFAELLGKRLPQ